MDLTRAVMANSSHRVNSTNRIAGPASGSIHTHFAVFHGKRRQNANDSGGYSKFPSHFYNLLTFEWGFVIEIVAFVQHHECEKTSPRFLAHIPHCVRNAAE